MQALLTEERFDFVTPADKEFLLAFNQAMNAAGYDCGSEFRDGFCWGIFMLVYTKIGVKSDKCYCRIYLRKESIAVRMYLNNVDEHSTFIERAPEHIKTAFTGEFGTCTFCKSDKESSCRYRKSYCIDNNQYYKCNGYVFEFWEPRVTKISDYLALLQEFYPHKTRRVIQ